MPVIRPACVDDIPAMARVHVDTWRTAYAGTIEADYLANLSYEYEKLGGRMVAEKVIEIGGQALTDVAYVWPDLSVF